MDKEALSQDIKNLLIKQKVDTANFDLAFKEFIKYFGEDVINPKEEKILEKVKGYTDIRAIPEPVIEMKDLIPNIRANIEGKMRSLGYEYNNAYESVIKELESYVLSTMINDIVKSKNHKSLYYDYRTAVKPKVYTYAQFKQKGTFERIVEKDNTGQIKKSIINLLSGTDGQSFFSSPVDFLENVNRFSKLCKVEFGERISMETIDAGGTTVNTERFSNPSVYNDNPLLMLRKITEYVLNGDEYIPTKQLFEIILVAEQKK